jgi:hypothetical protein
LRLIFDTGSDYLAITSSLCGDKRFDDEVAPSLFDGAEKAGSSRDASNGGVGSIKAPPVAANVQLTDEKPQRCDSQAYSLA